MKIKNYRFEGFGFPVIFDELPAVKVRGELVPDVDFDKYAKPLIEYICARQDVPLSGNQVKFIRNYFGMSLREFAKMLNVTHQSVMRWESNNESKSQIDTNTEFVFRIIVLRRLNCKNSMIEILIKKISEPSVKSEINENINQKSILFFTR